MSNEIVNERAREHIKMANDIKSKYKVWVQTSTQVSKDLAWTMANETTSKAIDETRATVKNQDMLGRVMSLEKNEDSALAFKIRTQSGQSCMFEWKPKQVRSKMAYQILLS